MKNKIKTNILFPRTSFLKGMGIVLNVSGNYYEFNYSENAVLADTKAIKADWKMVGEDINKAVELCKINK